MKIVLSIFLFVLSMVFLKLCVNSLLDWDDHTAISEGLLASLLFTMFSICISQENPKK